MMGKVVTSIRLDDEVLKCLKMFAAYEGTSISAVINKLVIDFLRFQGFYPPKFHISKEGEE